MEVLLFLVDDTFLDVRDTVVEIDGIVVRCTFDVADGVAVVWSDVAGFTDDVDVVVIAVFVVG